MIHKVKLYCSTKYKPDKLGYEMNNLANHVLVCTIPKFVDICLCHINIYFEDDGFSYARTYSVEKIFPAEIVCEENGNKKEKINWRSYRISFSNPRDNDREFSGIVELDWFPDIIMYYYRILRWFRIKDNILKFINIFS